MGEPVIIEHRLNWEAPDLLANMQILTADLAEHPGTWCFLSKYPF